MAQEIQLERPLAPFPLVVRLDAWNLRERDDWGRTRALRKQGQEPARGHWAYGATVFRLPDRAETAGGRRVILWRGYGMTRQGLDALRPQLDAEAVRRHGINLPPISMPITSSGWTRTRCCYGIPSRCWRCGNAAWVSAGAAA